MVSCWQFQVANPQVERLCVEAQECMVTGRWLDLVSLMLTSADLIFSKVSEKGDESFLLPQIITRGGVCRKISSLLASFM